MWSLGILCLSLPGGSAWSSAILQISALGSLLHLESHFVSCTPLWVEFHSDFLSFGWSDFLPGYTFHFLEWSLSFVTYLGTWNFSFHSISFIRWSLRAFIHSVDSYHSIIPRLAAFHSFVHSFRFIRFHSRRPDAFSHSLSVCSSYDGIPSFDDFIHSHSFRSFIRFIHSFILFIPAFIHSFSAIHFIRCHSTNSFHFISTFYDISGNKWPIYSYCHPRLSAIQ